MQPYLKSERSTRVRAVSVINAAVVSTLVNEVTWIIVGNEIAKKIVYEKQTPSANGPPILSNLAETFKKFWVTESKNDQSMKKLKLDYVIPELRGVPCTSFE